MSSKQMAIRHAGVCRECGVELPAKTTAVYDFTAKNVICLGCGDDAASAHQTASARAPRPAVPTVAGITDRRRADRRSADRRGAGNPN